MLKVEIIDRNGTVIETIEVEDPRKAYIEAFNRQMEGSGQTARLPEFSRNTLGELSQA